MSQGDVLTSVPLISSSSSSSGSGRILHEPPSWLADVLDAAAAAAARSWYDDGGGGGSLTFLCRLHSAAAAAATAEQRQLPEAADDEEVDKEGEDEYTKNGKSEEKGDEDGVCRRAWPTRGCHASASAFAAADPVLASRVCPGHIDDSDYDSHRVSQYKQRKYLTISAHNRTAAGAQRPQQQQQQQAPAAAARGPSPQQQAAAHGNGAAAAAARVRRHRHHHRISRKATRPSLGYTPTLRRLDEVEPTTAAATATPPEWQTSGDEREDVAGDIANSAQRHKSSTNIGGRDADVGADADRTAIGACRDKASSTGRDVASVVQEAERSSQFVFADSDSPIPSRVGRF